MSCKICGGLKHVKDSSGIWKDCECLASEKFLASLKKASFPPVYFSATLDSFHPFDESSNKAFDWVKQAATNYIAKVALSESAFFWDSSQKNSKLLASLVAKSAIQSGFSCKFTSVPDLFSGEMSDDDTPSMREYMGADLIVLDLAQDFMNKKVPSLLCGLMSSRFFKSLPIIFTSQHDMNLTGSFYSAAVMSSIRDTCQIQFKVTPPK